MDYKILDNSIVICSNQMKKNILNQNLLLNIKIMTINELIKKLTFDYDEKAIFHIMQKENIKYSLAQMYLDNIYYIENKEYESPKLKKLVEIKESVKELLIYDELFKNYIKNKKIIILNQKLTKYEKKVLNGLNYEEIDTRKDNYDHEVHVFKYLEDEVKYIGNKICELLEQGININKIKLFNVNEDYEKSIKRNFYLLNLKVNFKTKKPLISTIPGKIFIQNIENIHEAIEKISSYDSKIVNKIISICNKYAWSNYNEELIKEELRRTSINEEKYDNAIEIIDTLEKANDEYIFLMGFNEGIIPKTYKDEDYINDNIKMDYLETTLEKNINSKEETLKSIKSIKNLYITSKQKDSKQTFYVSNLLDNIKNENYISNKTYSPLLDKIEYAKYLDEYNKYGTINDELYTLANTYEIPYKKYNHSYKQINNFKLDKKLELSYTSFETYNECNFKYYISKILKLNIFENNFAAKIGTLIHNILELSLKENINIDNEIDKFINENELSNKETFFAQKLKQDLKQIIEIIKEQKQNSLLDKELYEQNIIIENENYNLVGKIDKIMYKEEDNVTPVAIIDYKTGNANIDLKYIDYNLNMQLPIYIYLINNSKLKNIRLVGFYLQKIHLETPKKENKSLYEMQKENLKLEGYSNKDKSLLKLLDKNFENSKIIKSMKVKTDGNFYNYTKVLTDEEIKELENKTKQKLNETAKNIIEGIFTINPKKIGKDNIGCRFCKFKDICFMEEYDTIKIEKRQENDTNETE